MRTKGFIFLVWLVGMIHAQAGDHVTELWRTSLGIENQTRYDLTDAVLDSGDNVVVGGTEMENIATAYGYIAKFNPAGEKLWNYSGLGDQFTAIESLKVDGSGNIYFIARTNYTGRWVTYGKLSPAGTPLWHQEVNCMVAFSPGVHHSLQVQADGTSHLLTWLVLGESEDDLETTMAVTKFSAAGEVLWTKDLPGRHLVGGPTDMGEYMKVDAAGNVLVTGTTIEGEDYRVFVLKLDADGNQLWRTVFPATAVTSVAAGPTGICVGLYEGFAILGTDGALVKKSLAHYAVIQTRDALANGQFLLQGLHDKRYILLNADGSIEWTAETQAIKLSNPIRDGNDGWFMAAHINHNGPPNEYSLIALRPDGNQRWRQPLIPFPGQDYQAFNSEYHAGYWLLRASDGSLRLVCRQSAYLSETYGIGIASYRLEESESGPQITSTPPAVVDWDGTEDLVLNYTATGEGPLTYRTIYRIPTGDPTITISKNDYPGASDLYYWDVTDANGRRAATRNTLVRLNQVRLDFDPPRHKVTAWGGYFTRVRMEYSTNLVNWQTWHYNPEGVGAAQIDLPIGTSTNYFFRAIKVE
jgi:hypothetical protein